MIGIVVSAHGELAAALANAAQLVVPGEGRVVTVAVLPDDDSASYEARLRSAIDAAQADTGVIVLTDMFGGTPSNVGMTLYDPGRVEVLTGVNLPMLIKALQLSEQGADLDEVAREVSTAGQRSIAVASEVLGLPGRGDEAPEPPAAGQDE